MALSQPRAVYGIHSLTPYRRSDGLPYGILLVLGGANLELTAEQEQLFGGSNKYAWASEVKTVSTQFTANVKSYEDFLFELFLGAEATENAAESGGSVTTLTDVNGTSVVDATTGIASVGIIPTTGAANLKFGKYVVKVTDAGADTVTIYAMTDIDFLKGTNASYTDDTLAVATAVIPGGSATVDVAALGIRFTGGSGTVAMTLGDTAEFYVRPINTVSSDIEFGQNNTVFPEFGCILLAQKQASFRMMEIELYKCSGSGMPINLQETAFSVADLTVTALYDSTKGLVGKIRHVDATS